MIAKESVFRKSDNIVMHKMVDEFVFVPVEENVLNAQRIYSTNAVGARVWELIDGSSDVSCIAQSIVSEYDADEQTVWQDVAEFIEAMTERGCVERV